MIIYTYLIFDVIMWFCFCFCKSWICLVKVLFHIIRKYTLTFKALFRATLTINPQHQNVMKFEYWWAIVLHVLIKEHRHKTKRFLNKMEKNAIKKKISKGLTKHHLRMGAYSEHSIPVADYYVTLCVSSTANPELSSSDIFDIFLNSNNFTVFFPFYLCQTLFWDVFNKE